MDVPGRQTVEWSRGVERTTTCAMACSIVSAIASIATELVLLSACADTISVSHELGAALGGELLALLYRIFLLGTCRSPWEHFAPIALGLSINFAVLVVAANAFNGPYASFGFLEAALIFSQLLFLALNVSYCFNLHLLRMVAPPDGGDSSHAAAQAGAAIVKVKSADLTCVICLSDMAPGEEVSQMPCGHCFHIECFGQWCARLPASQLQRRCPYRCAPPGKGLAGSGRHLLSQLQEARWGSGDRSLVPPPGSPSVGDQGSIESGAEGSADDADEEVVVSRNEIRTVII